MADLVQPIMYGVDVAKATLDIACNDEPVVRVANTPEAIGDWVASLPRQAHIAVEATGCYHETLVELAKAADHEVYLINGKQLRHYREAVGDRAKTDPQDACLILRFLTHEWTRLTPVKSLTEKEKRVWRLLQRRAKLVRARAQLKLSLESDPDTVAMAGEASASLSGMISRVERLVRALARELGWGSAIRRCQGIPGIGPLNALALVACFNRGDFCRSDQFVAYLGLDVRVRDSGTFRGRRKLTKRGNPELRRLLYNAAMSAVRTTTFEATYQRYLARGLSRTAALVAISRKLARIAFALHATGKTFDERACMAP